MLKFNSRRFGNTLVLTQSIIKTLNQKKTVCLVCNNYPTNIVNILKDNDFNIKLTKSKKGYILTNE